MRARIALEIPNSGNQDGISAALVRELGRTEWGHDSTDKLTPEQLSALLVFAGDKRAGHDGQLLDPRGDVTQGVLDEYVADTGVNSLPALRDALRATTGRPIVRQVAAQSVSTYLSARQDLDNVDVVVAVWRQKPDSNVYGLCYQKGRMIWIDLIDPDADVVRMCRATDALIKQITKLRIDNFRYLKPRDVTYAPVELHQGKLLWATGEVVQRRGRLAVTLEVIGTGPGLVYYTLATVFGVLSWYLHYEPVDWAVWLNNLFENLAAGFVGAGLVDNAVRYNRAIGDNSKADRRERRRGTANVRWTVSGGLTP